MNNYVLLILTIWVLCAIVAIVNKDSSCLGAAIVMSLFIGLGYVILHGVR